MRHHVTGKKFGRVRKVRTALMRSLALALFERGKIKTTEAKAKALRPMAEKLITRGKTDSVPSRRILSRRLGGGSAPMVKKLVSEISPKFSERKGGYTRIVKLSPRKSDGAKMAVIELVK